MSDYKTGYAQGVADAAQACIDYANGIKEMSSRDASVAFECADIIRDMSSPPSVSDLERENAAQAETIAALRAEVEQLRMDAERIDYIDHSARQGKLEIAPTLYSPGNGKGWEFGYWPGGRVELHPSMTFREALDAARKESA